MKLVLDEKVGGDTKGNLGEWYTVECCVVKMIFDVGVMAQ